MGKDGRNRYFEHVNRISFLHQYWIGGLHLHALHGRHGSPFRWKTPPHTVLVQVPVNCVSGTLFLIHRCIHGIICETTPFFKEIHVTKAGLGCCPRDQGRLTYNFTSFVSFPRNAGSCPPRLFCRNDLNEATNDVLINGPKAHTSASESCYRSRGLVLVTTGWHRFKATIVNSC